MHHPLLDGYDVLLVDLDGTVFAGGVPIDGAAEGLAGRHVMYVTNNASRSPQQVAAHLTSLGFESTPDQVMTSAMAACALARRELGLAERAQGPEPFSPAKASAFVIGDESFKQLAREAGFSVVDSADDHPDVVLHGHSPSNDWSRLSEGALAIRRGARYVASNLDTTLPSERGLLVGNGSMVAAVTSATGVVPVAAGKPGPAMFHTAIAHTGARRPLAIGDRLDTDIAGGNAAGIDTLCTLTGVSTHTEVLRAPAASRPTFIAANLRDHLPGWSAQLVPPTSSTTSPATSAASSPTTIVVHSGEHGPVNVMAAEALAVVAPIVWRELDSRGAGELSDAELRQHFSILGSDDAAKSAIDAWT